MERILPNLFIVGAPKCGTSAMSHYLKNHPEVFMSRKKEPHFFAPEWADVSYQGMTQQAYLDLFSDANGAKYAGEASVFYLASDTAAHAIKTFNPDSKIIIMLRSPVDMLYSLYYQYIQNGNEVLTRFADALAAEKDRSQGRRIPPRINPRWLQYRKIGAYTTQVQRFFDIFGRDGVHVIIYDDLRSDTASTYRKALDYLAVGSEFQTDFEIVNANVKIRIPAMNRFMKRPPRWATSMAPAYKAVMPNPLRLKIRRKLFDLNMLEAPRPPLDPELRQQLQQEFIPEVEALSELLGRDLTHWCKA